MKKFKKSDSWLIRAYRDEKFLSSPSARNIRILCEMMEPAHRLRKYHVYNTVVFFGSARSIPLAESQKKMRALQKSPKKSAKYKFLLAQAQQDLKLSRYYEDARELSKRMTLWFNEPKNKNQNFYVCSGGGPGMMEAANRGAKEANGKSVGLNISLPMEQDPNIFQTREISFEFHYFFIRKFWFFYLAKALVVFPGGYGTFDELFELLTIIQTEKTQKKMPVILYGKEFWNEVVNFEAMLKWGVISKSDLNLYHTVDDIDSAFQILQTELKKKYFQ